MTTDHAQALAAALRRIRDIGKPWPPPPHGLAALQAMHGDTRRIALAALADYDAALSQDAGGAQRPEAAPEPAGAWRPIASAPRDGTEICVAESGPYQWRFWSDHWRKYLEPYGEGFGTPARPTHWMPLPSPPEDGK